MLAKESLKYYILLFELYDESIDSAWMDEKTAVYGTDYICEFHPERKEELKFIIYSIE